MKLKINGLMDSPLWYKMKCSCKKGVVMESHPVKICLHCKYEICENSMPRNNFKVQDNILDKNGKPTGKTTPREIKEITIVRGSHDDITGWIF
tara:strand:+ start:64 stop:342 length:279 start_codon:yes stop_codon:yes gene_type:complete